MEAIVSLLVPLIMQTCNLKDNDTLTPTKEECALAFNNCAIRYNGTIKDKAGLDKCAILAKEKLNENYK